jgi:alanyl-tRNA synthetase
MKLRRTWVAGDALPGETAFRLYDTFGFPYDLTEDALRARGIAVDREGFDAAMARQRTAARAAWKGSGAAADGELWFDIAEREGASEFTGYTSTEGEGRVVALIKDGAEVASADAGEEVIVLTNQTRSMARAGARWAIRGRSPGRATCGSPSPTRPSRSGGCTPCAGRVESGRIGVGVTVHLGR